MSRITKSIAEHVATQMVKEKRQKAEDLEFRFNEKIRDLYMSRLPEIVTKAIQTHKEWICFSHRININGNGFSYLQIRVDAPVPIKPCNSNAQFTPAGEDESRELQLEYNASLKAITEVVDLKEKIEVALYSLKTYKNVERDFPEAAKFLPQGGSTTLPAVNLNSIRQELSK